MAKLTSERIHNETEFVSTVNQAPNEADSLQQTCKQTMILVVNPLA